MSLLLVGWILWVCTLGRGEIALDMFELGWEKEGRGGLVTWCLAAAAAAVVVVRLRWAEEVEVCLVWERRWQCCMARERRRAEVEAGFRTDSSCSWV